MVDLKKYIRDIPDFPSAGILFRDITPLLKDPKAFDYAINQMAEKISGSKPTAVAAIESRGFIFATPIAIKLGIPFIPVRKPGKLPYEAVSVEYSLEYGSGKLEMHADSLGKNDKVIIVDDLLATGGTAKAAADLCEKVGASVVGYQFAIELSFLGGRDVLAPKDVSALRVY
jgi:adenine phosphoribosyltransferase